MERIVDTLFPNDPPFNWENWENRHIDCILDPSGKLGGLFLGNYEAAEDPETYKKNNIKYVLTCAGHLDINYPKGLVDKYLILDAEDEPTFNMKEHFEKSIDFIEKYRKTGSSVYVHCAAGVSRSATVVIAYLMKTSKMNLNDAARLVKTKRSIVCPNEGFVRQLRAYEQELEGRSPLAKITSLPSKIASLPSKIAVPMNTRVPTKVPVPSKISVPSKVTVPVKVTIPAKVSLPSKNTKTTSTLKSLATKK